MDEWLHNLVRLWTRFRDREDPVKDFAKFYADPVSINGVASTIEQLVARARALNAGLSDLESEVLQIVEGAGAVDGDGAVALAFVMRGTHTGPYPTPLGIIPPTGGRWPSGRSTCSPCPGAGSRPSGSRRRSGSAAATGGRGARITRSRCA
jgi:hypothetical protein